MSNNYKQKDFNPESKESIYRYAKKLVGKTFNDICNENQYSTNSFFSDVTDVEYKTNYENKSRKGGLGELIEERYFHYKADNEQKADFPEAGVELKVTPYKVNINNSISAKERLIISMINYMEIINMDFYSSNAWKKLENILLVYYLWEPHIENRLDYMINFVYMYTPKAEDLEIIKNDFEKIRQKVLEGKAHELSEGDTLYLGAATKSSNSKARTQQPYSNIPAKPRAFSLKSSYMSYVLRNYIQKDSGEESILKGKKVSEFEQYVLEKIEKCKGEKDKDLFNLFLGTETPPDKNKYSRLAFEILGVKTKNAEEFEKANIRVKAIRVEETNKIREHLTIQRFKVLDLVQQDWENSDIYNYLNETKFLFVIYKKSVVTGCYHLKGAKFWNMPATILDGDSLKKDWIRVKKIFEEGVKFTVRKGKKVTIGNNLPKPAETNFMHVRPKARLAAHLINGVFYGNGSLEKDSDLLPSGDRMTNQCYWLNKDFILEQIQDKLT